MKRVSIVALAFAAACGSTSPIVAAPVDVTNARIAAPAYTGPAPTDEVVRLRVPVDGSEPSRGPADAKVTIVVFSDFQCPYCARVRPTLDRVMQAYGDNVRVIWRNLPLPFHDRARPAAALAMEAFSQRGDEGFWAAHDLIFMNQRALTDEDLRRYAGELGLNEQGVLAALSGAHDADIEADIAFAGTIGVRGTPGFIINGEHVRGAQPFEAFQAAIERATTAADFVIANGASQGNAYAALMQHASATPVPEAPRPSAPSRAGRGRPDPTAVYNVPVAGPLPTRGAASALVSIVVFSDFQCPYCSRLEPSLDEVLQRYPNDVRIVWMNHPLPFHQNAMPAAQAALEAFDQGGDAQFWAYHEKLFANQRALTRTDLQRYAQEVGLDMTQFNAALDNNEHRQVINDQAALAQRLGARGTPASFINGRYLSGAQPAASFITVVDEELIRARAAIASGTPRANIYDAMVSNGLAAPAAPVPSAAAAGPDAERDYGIAVPASAPSRGSSSAQIVIQSFSDFQCPFCSRVLPTVEQIMQQYGNQVRFVWRNYPLPFHSDAHLAAEAAQEVYAQRGDAGFWAYHDLLFANQRALGRAELETYAQQVGGVDMARFRSALDSRTHQAAVDADIQAVAASGARIGTPSFFINGRLVQGAQPFPAFQAAIDRELAR
ncbi:MAG: protein-disulfide isomerase [Polyangiales bacterium]|jgi:protein-disulfide isomerase